MLVRFPVDEVSMQTIDKIEADPDVRELLSILLDRKNKDFHNYGSIICFCYKEEDLTSLQSHKTLPKKVRTWIKRKSFERDDTYIKFFKHLFSLYSSVSQTYEGWDRLGKIRSIFPESYIYSRVRDRYASRPGSEVRRECYVVVDGWDSRIDRKSQEGQKIDIGAWDPVEQRGEIYEAKVKAYLKEKEHQLDFLETIRKVSKKRLDVILASFAPKQVVLDHLKNFFPNRKISNINVFGIDELENL